MLDREDMIALIRAEEDFNRLNDKVIALTGGYSMGDDEYKGLYGLYEVIRRNSRYPSDDDKDEEMFQAIIYAINKNAEEKYELLKPTD